MHGSLVPLRFDDPARVEVVERLREIVEKRRARFPLQYILGQLEFMSLTFEIEEGVFIPRPETELLVEAVLDRISTSMRGVLVDVGVGCGVIAICIALKRPQLRVMATDVSTKALQLAGQNAARHGVSHRVELFLGDLLKPLKHLGSESVDVIVSNPPYISSKDLPFLQPELRYEPREALEAGSEGLDVYKSMIPEASEMLKYGGFMALELGAGQSKAVSDIAFEFGLGHQEFIRDYSGHHRILIARKSQARPEYHVGRTE